MSFSSKKYNDDFIEVEINGFSIKETFNGKDLFYNKIYLKAPDINDQVNLEIIATSLEKLYYEYQENTLRKTVILAGLSKEQTLREVVATLTEKQEEVEVMEKMEQSQAVRKEIINLFQESISSTIFLSFIRQNLAPFFSAKIYIMQDGNLLPRPFLLNYIFNNYKKDYYLFIEELFIEYYGFFLEFLPSRTLTASVETLCHIKASSQESEKINS